MLSICFSRGEIAWAQKDAASIVGTVEDPSGAVVPGAQVTATDVDRGTSFVTSTVGSGNYVAGPMIRGTLWVARVPPGPTAVPGLVSIRPRNLYGYDSAILIAILPASNLRLD